jgi:pimeloyl-ACP methyl ester carboxylesterase
LTTPFTPQPSRRSGSIPWYERRNLDVQEFSAAGIRTFAVVEGRPESFPVVFLHGIPGGAFVWASIIKSLGRERLVIAPDWPGWGRSYAQGDPGEFAYTPESAVAWLKGLLDAHRIDRFDLVAQGNAVWPALELVKENPNRVRRLALVSARLWRSEGRRLLGIPRWTSRRIELWFEQRSSLGQRAREEWRPQFYHLLGEDEAGRTARAPSEKDYENRFPDYRAVLEAYPGAMLLVWGENDPRSPESKTDELTSTLPNSEVYRIQNAGGFPTLDCPDEVAAVFKEFLAE